MSTISSASDVLVNMTRHSPLAAQIHVVRRDSRDEGQFKLLVVAHVPTRASHARHALSKHHQYVTHRPIGVSLRVTDCRDSTHQLV